MKHKPYQQTKPENGRSNGNIKSVKLPPIEIKQFNEDAKM